MPFRHSLYHGDQPSFQGEVTQTQRFRVTVDLSLALPTPRFFLPSEYPSYLPSFFDYACKSVLSLLLEVLQIFEDCLSHSLFSSTGQTPQVPSTTYHETCFQGLPPTPITLL